MRRSAPHRTHRHGRQATTSEGTIWPGSAGVASIRVARRGGAWQAWLRIAAHGTPTLGRLRLATDSVARRGVARCGIAPGGGNRREAGNVHKSFQFTSY
jgi:hypothetical protein